MAIQRRNIFANHPSLDYQLPAVTRTPGRHDSPSERQPFGPEGITDQSGLRRNVNR